MNLSEILKIILSLLTGYLVGSFLPGYFLPLWVRKVDIRKMGDGNPGLINVKKNAGGWLALFTGLYDLPKGLLSVLIIHSIYKLPISFAYLAGIAAIMGHKFPFYLGFKGGRGFAATIGLFIYMFVKILTQNFTLQECFPLFVFIVTLALFIFVVTHAKSDVFTVLVFPGIGIFMLLYLHVLPDLLFFLVLISILTIEAGRNLARDFPLHPPRN